MYTGSWKNWLLVGVYVYSFGLLLLKILFCVHTSVCVCEWQRKSLRLPLPDSAWSLSGSVRQKNVWVPQKHNPRPRGHVPLVPSTLDATSYVILFITPFVPAGFPYILLIKTLLSYQEKKASITISGYYSCKPARPSHPSSPLGTSDHPHAAAAHTPTLSFLHCFSVAPIVRAKRERCEGGRWRRKRGEEGKEGECALSVFWACGVHPHQGVEIPL